MREEFFCVHENLCQNQNGSTFLCQNNLTTFGLGLSLSPVKWPVSCILTTDLKLKFVTETKKFLTKCMYLLTPDLYWSWPVTFACKMAGVLHFDNRLKVKIRNRNEEISYQMHVFANSRYILALKNTFELPCDEMSFIYLKIQAANLRAHILTDLNNENRNVSTDREKDI